MIITITEDDIKKPLSAEAKKRIIEASKRPIVYDDDCPEFTDEELREMVELARLEKQSLN